MQDTAAKAIGVSDRARQALKEMSRWSVTPSPENYHVWFNHLSGHCPALSRAIDDIVAAEEPFTEETMTLLYRDYIGKERDQRILEEAQQETQTILQAVLQETLKAGNLASDYQQKLEHYSEELTASGEHQSMEEVIKSLISDTAEMTRSSVEMQQRLNETTEQADSLRERLDELQQEAAKDVLTGLSNRKAADDTLNEMFQIYGETRDAFTVIMLDIDHFKKFNDTFGHRIGDAVLQRVGAALRENLKGRDFPARYGGEEFIVFLQGTPLGAATTVAEHIRIAISLKRLKIADTDQQIGTITASFGVAEVRSDDTMETVVERADKAMYLAKKSGRDQVKTEQDL